MISDPATTPVKLRDQIIFGLSIAFVYSVLVYFHIVFGQFFSLLIVCIVRGVIIHVRSMTAKPVVVSQQPAVPAMSIEYHNEQRALQHQ